MKIETLKGMKDIVFLDMDKYEYIIEVAKEVFSNYGYSRIQTPILEETELFKRSVGDETDVVSKEMYTFLDKGNRDVTLRPEGTAGVVRAYLNLGLHKSNPIAKFYYYGTMYRYEAPQKGRYREFSQIGVESFGIRSPFLDAELINMATIFLKRLGIDDLVVELNSLGNVESRKKYIESLQNYLIENLEKLSEDSKKRTYKNPLRVLDSKDENDKKILENAPCLYDYFDEDSKEYFENLRNYLNKLDVTYIINPKLVRGLDYYSDTVFEIKSNKLGAQSTVLGGGRYDKLTEILSNVEIPAIGFAAGIERLALIIDEKILPKKNNKVYLIHFEDTKDYMLEIVKKLREKDINLEYEYTSKSFAYQMKKANKLGVEYALILGENEKNENKITLKNLKNSSQEILDIDDVLERIKNV